MRAPACEVQKEGYHPPHGVCNEKRAKKRGKARHKRPVLDSPHDLLEDFARLILGQLAAADYEIEEFAVGAVSAKEREGGGGGDETKGRSFVDKLCIRRCEQNKMEKTLDGLTAVMWKKCNS